MRDLGRALGGAGQSGSQPLVHDFVHQLELGSDGLVRVRFLAHEELVQEHSEGEDVHRGVVFPLDALHERCEAKETTRGKKRKERKETSGAM